MCADRVVFPPPGPLVERVVFSGPEKYLLFTRTGLERVESLLEANRAMFESKFRRQPNPDDPIFWDPDSPTPVPMSNSVFLEMVCSVLAATGTAPAIVHAVRRTGMVMTSQTAELFSQDDHARFMAHVDEYLGLTPPPECPP